MALYTFAYTAFQIPASVPFPNGQTVYRPYLVADVKAPATGKSVRAFVWPDSGADQCVFPLSFASLLGLDPLKMPMQMTGGVGSAANVTHYADIEVQIPVTQTASISFSVFAGFTAGLEAQGIGLLGQSGFFEKFQVVFSHSSKTFQILTP
jgi:hypothetical protein